jgi:hypothetical protein
MRQTNQSVHCGTCGRRAESRVLGREKVDSAGKKVVGACVFCLRWKGPGRPFGVALHKRKREPARLAQYGTRTASSQAADDLLATLTRCRWLKAKLRLLVLLPALPVIRRVLPSVNFERRVCVIQSAACDR